MGKKNRKRQKKMKGSKKPASNKSKTTAPTTSNWTEGDVDYRKGIQQCIEEIRGASNFPQMGSKGIDNEKYREISKESSTIKIQISSTDEFEMTDGDIAGLLGLFVESKTETTGGSTSSSQGRTGIKTLRSTNPQLLTKVFRRNIAKVKRRCYKNLLDMVKSSKELSRDEAFQVFYDITARVAIDMHEEIEMEIAKLNSDCSEITKISGEIFLETVGTNVDDGPVDDNQDARHSTKILTLQDEVYSQESELSQNTEEYNDEELVKIVDCCDEIMGRSKDVSKMIHKNEMLRQNKLKGSSSQEIQRHLKKYPSLQSSKSNNDMGKSMILKSTLNFAEETRNARFQQQQDESAEAFEAIKASKEKADEINDMLIAINKIEGDKKTLLTSLELDAESKLISTEDTIRENKGKEDREISNKDSQDFYSLNERKFCNRKDNDDKIKNILPVRDFQRFLREFMKMQNSNLDEQVKKYRESLEVVAKEQPDHFHSEKERLTAVTMTELQKKTRVATKNEDGRFEGDVKTAEIDDQTNERVTQQLNSEKEKLRFSPKVEDCKRKDNKDKTTYPENTKVMSGSNFQRDYEKFITKLESAKLEEQEKKIRKKEFEKIVTNEQLELFSSEEGQSVADAMTGLNEENKVATSNKDGRIEKVMKSAEEDKEPDEKVIKSSLLDDAHDNVIVLEKNCKIRFDLFTNGSKRIFVGDQCTYYFSDKQRIILKYRGKCTQVFFAGNQVFVSTPQNEFDIFVRDSLPINVANESTQTDSL